MSEKLRWGILGSARIVRKTIPALQATRNGEVVGIASRTEEKAREYAGKHGIPQAFGSYEALLASPDIDAVYIPLPNTLHLEWILKSLDAGKHVLCEKPLAMSASECETIARKADETGLKVLEGFMYRFHPRFEKLQELLAANAVGALKFIHVAHSFDAGGDDNIRWYTGLGGGALFDTGCYCVNVSRMVTSEEPEHVAAFGNYRDAKDEGRIDTSIAGMLRFPGGSTALFDTGVNLERRNFLEVTGTEGRLYLGNPFSLLEEDSVLEEHHFGQDSVYHQVKGENHFVRMGEHFADSALNGTPLRYDLADAANNAQALQALDATARAQDRAAEYAPHSSSRVR
ncbi:MULTISPECIES: Gfo/Idh/MocA family protein [Arthrobacter]|uniref:Gfo/Idh/MocA family oxidoreductase n=1 Tax=Arthrobacter terricola TaxID=2547396 RepID=A0A4R5K559_9MICC|nr:MULTISPECIES: Gfo/Idh/MocA family oxidoreductase [Arthrobacter]MBT8163675.1 Gfo/Idh/MocA family oxidoreductase [Arthrobacter sp. GN70]TDF87712.1 Gfo/Idh/MocA family oxidoreductase [Arthrobacter terricola]